MLVARSEGSSYSIEDNQHTLAAGFLFQTLDGCGQRLGVDQTRSHVKLSANDSEGNTSHTMPFAPRRDSSFRQPFALCGEEDYEALFDLSAMPIQASRDVTANIAD